MISPYGASIMARLQMPIPTRFQILGATSIMRGAVAKVDSSRSIVALGTRAPRGPVVSSTFWPR